MDKNKRSSGQGGAVRKWKERQRAPAGLEAEAGFEKWIAFVRERLGCSYAWNGPFANALERVNAIDREAALLLEIAPQWSAEEFYRACTAANPDVTKGSEHFVTRYLEGSSPRVVKATIPGKYGRHEYSPSFYLNVAIISTVSPGTPDPYPWRIGATRQTTRSGPAEHRYHHAVY